jgi:uncharacterized protein
MRGAMALPTETVIAHTRAWVARVVIGLNLCPFAAAVQTKEQVRYVVCDADDLAQLLATLCAELRHLAEADPAREQTTLLIHPNLLQDFDDFNDFLDAAEAAVDELELEGVLQVASFHPQYRFAGTEPGDITNATNRSPYPTLHLLREDSVERAVAAVADPEDIPHTNMHTLRQLGDAGWARLAAACAADAGL